MAPRIVKPRRGARLFLREVMVVMLGVLVALALEHWLIGFRDGQRARDMRESMNEELADFTGVAAIRVTVAPCIEAKLDAIDAFLRDGSGGAGAEPLTVGRPPFFFSSRGAWNSDASDLLSRSIGPATLRVYGIIYQGMEQFTAIAQREQQDWVTLQTIEVPGRPIGEERRWRLIDAAAGARNAHLLLNAIAEQMLGHIDGLGVERAEAIAPEIIRARPICAPLAAG